MTSLFISDLHLDDGHPKLLAGFRDWCRGPARKAERVFILGDLFEAWIGDDDDAPWAQQVIAELRNLSDTGINVWLQHGNRDFLMGDTLCQASGASLLPEAACIDLYGRPTLLLHGDTLCTDDTAYQAFRSQVRDPVWQQAVLSLPLAERRQLAVQLRNDSQLAQGDKTMVIMDVNAEAVVTTMTAHKVDLLIHGHTHRPARHNLTVAGHPAERIVLGDWGTYGWQLRAEADGELSLEKWEIAAGAA